jgi:hypothetical protein
MRTTRAGWTRLRSDTGRILGTWPRTSSTGARSPTRGSSSMPTGTSSTATGARFSQARTMKTRTSSRIPGRSTATGSSAHGRGIGRDKGPLRVRLRGLQPGPSDGAHRLRLPGSRMATQGNRARRPPAPAALGQDERLTVLRRLAATRQFEDRIRDASPSSDM